MGLSQNQKLYFIALLPNEEIKEDITEFKHYIAEKYRSKHALKSPPHITLIPPFKWNKDNEDELIKMLNTFSANQKSFSIQIENFAAFKPRVIFVDLVSNAWLEDLYWGINDVFKNTLNEEDVKPRKKFSPHITIAFRDLNRKMFYKAWDEFKEKKYAAEFNAEQISLLRHNGKMWEVIHHAPLLN